MYTIIHTSLIRQSKALSLLCELMEEEYTALLDRNTDAVVALEFSIQELIRQLAAEKATVITTLAGVRVAEYAGSLSAEEGGALLELLRAIDKAEQGVARQATRNSQLSLALLDQSSRTLQALTSQAMPPKAETYGRRGGMRVQHHPEAALISGRL
ncbi:MULTISPECIES: flagellar protein FlgN [Desulfovibrio]|uniref:FlgN protein n=1 Tax=Desulfovibrio desulfuricans TaxID=876 RepID=A0AA94HQ76_DESDE|nr:MULTISPECIES: flagellar protein FlgN [Desulfovibrio]ATD80355.1 flagellar protein FlgN [Desulfovibrio sp. G11]MDY0203019.1 flagellar protein FlgN [Desulfovibrio desulfuricans]SFW12045.1 FlgN protein [Desulfovibrio desulfuricans]SPD35831.1 Flagellar export chaperone, FlgN [Desulfovibrio sp. G11]